MLVFIYIFEYISLLNLCLGTVRFGVGLTLIVQVKFKYSAIVILALATFN